MKIALVHSFYSRDQASGENTVVERQGASLTRAGHAVELFAEETDDRRGETGYSARAAARVATGRGTNPLRAIHDFDPDVVHVHNLFPNFGRRWVFGWGGPLVVTLHNFRTICPAGTLFRAGHICRECPESSTTIPAIKYGCYRGSRIQTLPLAIGTSFSGDPLLKRADVVVVLSELMKQEFRKVGLSEDRIAVNANFVTDAECPRPGQGDSGAWLFAGRLSPEKGIVELLQHWPRDYPLLVAGDGPLRSEVEALAGNNVSILGPLSRTRLQETLRHSKGLVFPSLWLEGFPSMYVESLAAGTPVLSVGPSVVSSLIQMDETGLTSSMADVVRSLRRASEVFPGMRTHCRTVYATKYSESRGVSTLLETYQQAISHNRRSRK